MSALLAVVLCALSAAAAPAAPLDNKIVKLPSDDSKLEPLLKVRTDAEDEIQRTEKLNRGFEKMIQIVDIMGQLDSYVSDKTKAMLRKLATLAEDDVPYPHH